MKVGDLVMLSAYGKKRKRAGWIAPDDVGLIIKEIVYDQGWAEPDYLVKWRVSSKTRNHRDRWEWQRHNTRKDLRYAK